jgi:hypothetical protein
MRFSIGQGLTAAFVTARAVDTIDQVVRHPSGTRDWLRLTATDNQLFFLRSALITGVAELTAARPSPRLRTRVHYILGVVGKYVDVVESAEHVATRAGAIIVVPTVTEPRKSFLENEPPPKLH